MLKFQFFWKSTLSIRERESYVKFDYMTADISSLNKSFVYFQF